MIRRTVSAAFLLRDGFTGRTLTGFSGTRCLLDGRPLVRPIWKKEGYLVLTDVEPGEHELIVMRSGYIDEHVKMDVREDAAIEDTISLKPGAGYRFPPETVRVSLSLHRRKDAASDERLWLGQQPHTRLVLAQERAEAGETLARLFCEGNAGLLPIPGYFLFTDKTAPEIVYLRHLRDEEGAFLTPLCSEHPRGTELIPVQSYESDGDGNVCVLLKEPGTLIGFFDGRLFTAQLNAGRQTLAWGSEE